MTVLITRLQIRKKTMGGNQSQELQKKRKMFRINKNKFYLGGAFIKVIDIHLCAPIELKLLSQLDTVYGVHLFVIFFVLKYIFNAKMDFNRLESY